MIQTTTTKKMIMNKIKFLLIALVFALCVSFTKAQNIQLLHNFNGENKLQSTLTLENFSQDKLGTTFYFVDIDLFETHNPTTMFTKIMRTFKLGKSPFSAHIEYNGGLIVNQNFSAPINNVYLVGFDYYLHNKSHNKRLNIKLLQRFTKKVNHQVSVIWGTSWFNGDIDIDGYVHYWEENGKQIIYSEPQVWFNVTNFLALGGEVKIGYNFNHSKWKATPALGLKVKI